MSDVDENPGGSLRPRGPNSFFPSPSSVCGIRGTYTKTLHKVPRLFAGPAEYTPQKRVGSPRLRLPAGCPPFDFTFLFLSSATGDQLKAHKDTLSSKCEFFRAMFGSGMSDAQVDHMTIDEFSPGTMFHFLYYLYDGNLHESFCGGELFADLFKAGSFFGCPALCSFLLGSVNDLGTLCAAAESILVTAWPEDNIPEHVQSFVVWHLEALLTSEKLIGLSEGALCVLVSLASRGMCWAVTIFRLLESWACQKGLKTLPVSLVGLVPFERMWAAEFEEHVVTSPLMPREVLAPLKSRVPLARDWHLLTGAPVFMFDHIFRCCFGIAVAPQKQPKQLAVAAPATPSFVVCVTDIWDHTVHVFDGTTCGNAVESFGSDGSGPSAFAVPIGIAVSAISGGTHENDSSLGPDVFVSDCYNNRVQVWSSTGVCKRSFGSGQLGQPQGLSIDHVKHEVHVCDSTNNCISVFAESDGTHLFSYGSRGSDPGQLILPTDVAVDGERGLVAVVDQFNVRVSVFKTSGEFVRCFGQNETDSHDQRGHFGKGDHKFVALDPQSGHIVVSDSVKVQVMTWEGEWVGGFGPGLPVEGPELQEVRGVTVGPQGQLFLCCKDSNEQENVLCF